MYGRVLAAETMIGVRGMSLPPPVEPLLVPRRAPLGQVKKAAQQHMADIYTMLEHWQVRLLLKISFCCVRPCHGMSCTVRYSVRYLVLTVHQKLFGVLHDGQVVLMLRHLAGKHFVSHSLVEHNALVLLTHVGMFTVSVACLS